MKKRFLLIVSFFLYSTSYARPLKILFVVNKFPYSLQTFVINQMRSLLDRGHHVYIFSIIKTDEEISADLAQYNFDNRVFYNRIPEYARKYDIIHCQFHSLAGHCLRFKILGGLQGKLIVSFRGGDVSEDARNHPRFFRYLFQEAKLFLPVCEYFKEKLIKLRCNPDKIMVLHSVLDCSKFKFKERTPPSGGPIRIVTVCRIVKGKGVDYAIRAVAQLVKKHRNIEYVIVGDGDQRENLQKLVTKLGIGNIVTFLGRKSHEEVAQILDTGHIFIHPSITDTDPDSNKEGIPNAIKEAMATGLPVISTYHNGIPELVTNGKEGFLVPEKDVKALTNGLEHLIKHPEIWPAMGRAGRRKIEQEYDMKKENEKLLAVLNQLVMPGEMVG